MSEKLFILIGKINPNIAKQYNSMNQKWWNYPEEKIEEYSLFSYVYFIFGISMWILTAMMIIFAFIGFLSNSNRLLFSFGVFSMGFFIAGYILQNLSLKLKKKIAEEKDYLIKSKENKISTDTALNSLYIESISTIQILIENGMKNDIELQDFSYHLERCIRECKSFQLRAKELYLSNRRYTYNSNEPMEVEAFSYTDSLEKYEELIEKTNNLVKLLEKLNILAVSNRATQFMEHLQILFDNLK